MLGKSIVTCKGRFFDKTSELIYHDGKKIELTIFSENKKKGYLILYMHGNSSCRVEAFGLVRYLPLNVSLACFDFMGCGKNE